MHYASLLSSIKNRRNVLHITQEYLAEISGVSLRTIKEIESGKGNPTLETLGELADVLGMELTLVIKQPNP
ncbi:helix-turn-helix transcriptional regulator [Spirosoma sp.]|uniref:helix-turn-helix transcriptional regulator n=1 Tax=Spirosoma sp. TaxID=1899569 RepID=UPI0026331DFA|nr:helix-turn-helix transcriptional regulator [Spirosoma sp.]MCX6216944.1 helix-turn-helix transcriptional regulator [Spirosoma sp.]